MGMVGMRSVHERAVGLLARAWELGVRSRKGRR